jgi:hypothetical protein
MYRDTLLDARKESKKVLDIYERFDPSLGNRLVYGQLGRNAQFLAFPGGESRSTLSKLFTMYRHDHTEQTSLYLFQISHL